MRKVEVFKYDSNGSKVSIGEGIFHSFGINYEELQDGVGNYSIAIVELKDGSVVTSVPELVVFLEPL